MRREQEALRARNADRPRGYKRLLPEKVKKTRGRGGGTPYNGLYGEAPPERGTFFLALGVWNGRDFTR